MSGLQEAYEKTMDTGVELGHSLAMMGDLLKGVLFPVQEAARRGADVNEKLQSVGETILRLQEYAKRAGEHAELFAKLSSDLTALDRELLHRGLVLPRVR